MNTNIGHQNPKVVKAIQAQAEKLCFVHPGNAMTSVSRDDLSKIFLRKTTTWSGPDRPEPVDLVDGPTRTKFFQAVHQKSAGSIRLYWQQQVFSGRGTPPEEKASDQAVAEYVARTPNGIGYVSETAATPGVKVITFTP